MGRPAELLVELFDQYAPMVLGLCRSLLRDPHDGEDAAQQTFLSAYASLLGGTRPRNPAGWLATIARNECRTRAQRRMREPLPLGETRVAAAPVVAQAADVESLRIALAQLPSQQRQAFLLREFSGLSYGELASALGVTMPAVESLLFRARRQLRVSLRAAAAAAISWPVAVRDSFLQFFAGSGDASAPATLAKLGSMPLLAKLASVGAGAALMTAGAVAVEPLDHRSARDADPVARTAVSHPTPSSRPRQPVVAAAAAPVAVRAAAEHAPSAAHREPMRATTSDERANSDSSSGGAGRDHSAPSAQSRPPKREQQDGHESSSPPQDVSPAPIQTSDSHDGSGDASPGGDGGSGGGSGSDSGGDGGTGGTTTTGD